MHNCECCDYTTSRKDLFDKHILSRKHTDASNWKQKVEKWCDGDRWICNYCDYQTDKHGNFEKHLLTAKHIERENVVLPNEVKEVTVIEYICEICTKPFSSRTGLWKHKKKCVEPVHDQTLQFLEIIEKKEEEARKREDRLLERMDRRDEETRKLIIEICKNSSVINNNTLNDNSVTNIQNIQNNFNLNLFLNETCKDAVNMSDFIDNVNIEMEDMENYANNGFVEALSTVVIRNLEELGTERRPIHCTDVKRETVYIKENNKWEKGEKAKELFQIMITRINKSCGPVLQKWKDRHPSCIRSDSPYTNTYNNMICNIMGGDSNYATTRNKILTVQEKEDKVMSLIAAAMTINKSK
jgi:hypothetical protein